MSVACPARCPVCSCQRHSYSVPITVSPCGICLHTTLPDKIVELIPCQSHSVTSSLRILDPPAPSGPSGCSILIRFTITSSSRGFDHGAGHSNQQVAGRLFFMLNQVKSREEAQPGASSISVQVLFYSCYCKAIKMGISPWPSESGRNAFPITAPKALSGSLVFIA